MVKAMPNKIYKQREQLSVAIEQLRGQFVLLDEMEKEQKVKKEKK